MGKMSKIQIKADQIKEEDIVISENKEEYYIVIKKGKTIMHKHNYIKVRYRDGEVKKWMIQDIKGKREVYRFRKYL